MAFVLDGVQILAELLPLSYQAQPGEHLARQLAGQLSEMATANGWQRLDRLCAEFAPQGPVAPWLAEQLGADSTPDSALRWSVV